MSETTTKPYSEDDDFVPDKTAMSGTLETTDVAPGNRADLRSVTTVFDESFGIAEEKVADALDREPDNDYQQHALDEREETRREAEEQHRLAGLSEPGEDATEEEKEDYARRTDPAHEFDPFDGKDGRDLKAEEAATPTLVQDRSGQASFAQPETTDTSDTGEGHNQGFEPGANPLGTVPGSVVTEPGNKVGSDEYTHQVSSDDFNADGSKTEEGLQAQQAGAASKGDYDPADHSNPEVNSELDRLAEEGDYAGYNALLDAEVKGKNRTGIVKDREAYYDPDSETVEKVNEYLDKADEDEKQRVLEAEKAGQNRKGIVGDDA